LVSLRELQIAFAAALRDPNAAVPVLLPDNLAIYRNNSAYTFLSALENDFPVLRRRVGDDYFSQLVAFYRERFPSRSGDLHWAGRNFSGFLEDHLQAGEYAWLSDLARLEWSRVIASVAAVEPSLGADVLGSLSPEQLEQLVFSLQPSLMLLSSAFPIFDVWAANQNENATPVDQSIGCQQGMVRAGRNGVVIKALDSKLFPYLAALSNGKPLGEAVEVAGLDEGSLVTALGFIFSESLVTGVRSGSSS